MKRIFTILLGIALFSCCIQEELKWTIGDILERPESYGGKNITIEGEYMGWETGCAPTGPPVTRSDWQIKDETGCIYVTNIFLELDPYQDIGTRVKVTGTIRVSDVDIPYIKALKVEIPVGNETPQSEDNETEGIEDIFTEPEEEITPPSLPL